MSNNPKTTVKHISVTRCPVPTASSLAFDRGLLHKELAKVGFLTVDLNNERNVPLLNAHFDHSLPFLVREGGNIPALWARSTGRDTRLVALSWVDEYQAILALPDSSIFTPADLRGRRVGIPRHRYLEIDFRAAQALRGVHNALGLAGLTLDDVELVDLEAPNEGRRDTWITETDALRSREVDAIFVKGATGLQVARAFPTREIVELGFHPDPLVRVNNGVPRTVTVDAELTQHEGVVEHILTALLRSADWAENHRDDFTRIIAQETGASPNYVEAAYRNGSLRPTLHKDLLTALDAQRKFLLDHGFLAGDVNVWEWAFPGPLTAAEHNLKKESPLNDK
ncbi:ABC-type nitrate/sulfonate/bicarbonate transport system substrate-binding protein [Neobacillus niacini]|uniref:ABC transporter substrate-binding protein n=1 Tax=Neobacillus niacini TaxID=86668 RepID=UPI00285CCCE5|nr:ABC transporter substrate-binding protein [Neobacillus niacini]MDR7079308.1 ABC-type nitrate/sulfonate/bicarbonate transport system substrate-binding protein [Neobacillus niacini]